MKITFLGTGTSHGVPPIDCMMRGYESCPQGVCKAAEHDAKHRRTRSSVLVAWDDISVLIDAGPDLREQCLREKVLAIDAVLLTHHHADHIFGIPDLRSYTREHPLPLYGSESCIRVVRSSFAYAFDPATPVGGGIPKLETCSVDTPFTLFGQVVVPVRVEHLGLDGCYGYRIGDFAYIPDVKYIAPGERAKLDGVKVLVLNCLRLHKEHVSHLVLEQSIALARTISPEKCYFIHMSHDIHYITDKKNLDPWMDFSWDGLTIEL